MKLLILSIQIFATFILMIAAVKYMNEQLPTQLIVVAIMTFIIFLCFIENAGNVMFTYDIGTSFINKFLITFTSTALMAYNVHVNIRFYGIVKTLKYEIRKSVYDDIYKEMVFNRMTNLGRNLTNDECDEIHEIMIAKAKQLNMNIEK